MDVRRPVIIRIDDYPEPINCVDRRHTILYTKPKRLGIVIYPTRIHRSPGVSSGSRLGGRPRGNGLGLAGARKRS